MRRILMSAAILGLCLMVSGAAFAVGFRVIEGEKCPAGWTLMTPDEARAHRGEVCEQAGEWFIMRLEGGGSMDGPGYQCKIRDQDTRGLGNAVCVQLEMKVSNADATCDSGYTLVTYAAAEANRDAACKMFGDWFISRLAEGGSMDGPGYQCKIRPEDQRSLGNSLCRKLF